MMPYHLSEVTYQITMSAKTAVCASAAAATVLRIALRQGSKLDLHALAISHPDPPAIRIFLQI